MLARARRGTRAQNERGQVIVIFALMIPVFLGLGGIVIGVGNWYTHGKHLQTKADAGALAGGLSWEFPCGAQIDARIEAKARQYAATDAASTPLGYNPQVGGVPDTSIHTVLNGSAWYDNDSNPLPTEHNSPPNPSVCDAKILDVKVTEDDSFPLFSLIPLFPDIKRKARVEIQEAEGINGVLPIAVRAPEPVSAAAVYYDEANGNILTQPNGQPAVKYFVKNSSIFGLPANLQGWTTDNPEDTIVANGPWARFTPTARTGVVIAISFRGACNTGPEPPQLPAPGQQNITTSSAPCFEDNKATVFDLCNQGGSTQIVDCSYDTGNWPSETTVSGLHFLRGYPTTGNGDAAPLLRSAWLENAACATNGYFNAHPNASCTARLHAVIDIGSLPLPVPPPNGPQTETRTPANVEVRYRIVNDTGNYAGSVCTSFNTVQCELTSTSSGPGDTTWVTTNRLPLFNAQSGRNSIALRVRLTSPTKVGATSCNASGNNCQFYVTANGTGPIGGAAPTDAAVLAAPVQRMFRGNSLTSSSVQWLRLTADPDCIRATLNDIIDNDAASRPTSGDTCFLMDMGLKGGIAKDANEQPLLFNDGVGSSQMGSVDCDPNINQGQVLIDGVIQGCGPWYAKHPFDWNPLCPSANSIFNGYPLGNPGPPWNDGRWPPLRCVKTRPTGSMNQLRRGLPGRLFGNQNQNSCPGGAAGGPGFIQGRNYWDMNTANGYVAPAPGEELGYKESGHDTHFNKDDKRIVTIFLVPTEAFAGNGQNTYPITGFIEVYITGWGRISGNGSISVDDPCPGSQPPTDLDLSGGNAGGTAVWGHVLNYALPNPQATPSGVICNPGKSTQPCVAVLVE